MIVKVGPETFIVSYDLIKKVGDTENYGFQILKPIEHLFGTAIEKTRGLDAIVEKTWNFNDLDAVKKFISDVVEKELSKEYDIL